MRPRSLVCSLLLVVVALSATGCGGTKTYSAEKTRKCLKDAGVHLTAVPGDDLVAAAAEGDAFSVRFPDNLVTLSFGVDRDGAQRIVRAYQRFKGSNIGLEDALRASHNAVMLWAIHPKDEYAGTIEGCLR